MSKVAQIALDCPLRRTFDYQIPADLSLTPGQRVLVPFGHQQRLGMLVALSNQSQITTPLKPILHAFDDQTQLPEETLKTLLWCAAYYQHPIGECVFLALPPTLRKAPRQISQAPFAHQIVWQVSAEADAATLARAPRQQRLLAFLQQQTSQLTTEAIIQAGYSRALLNQLVHRQFLQPLTVPQHTPGQVIRETPPSGRGHKLRPLNPAQAAVFAQLMQQSMQQERRVQLLYGITGSGKTDVYLNYIDAHTRQPGDQALVLVPEINLTPQTLARFRDIFDEKGDGKVCKRVLPWHSALSAGEKLAIWQRVRAGDPVVLVGTRSAVLLPFVQLTCLVVDEEHDASYKQQEGLRYHARDLAILRAHHFKCPILLGSATPSLESLHNCHNGKYSLFKLATRAADAQPPAMALLDIRSRPLQAGVSQPLREAIAQRLAKAEQVLVFVNRRGFAPVIMCFDCGHLIECPRCDARLTFHRQANRLRCHHCDYQQRPPVTCPKCGSTALEALGQGTERAEAWLTEQFPDTPVLRVDRDSTRNRHQMAKLLKQVNTGAACILVGTQMLAKGHDFPGVTLVAVLNADGGLFSTDFRAPEQLAQTLLQVSGRAGRGSKAGQVLIQSCQADHPLLQSLCSGDYLTVAEKMLAERQAAGFPPYRYMALIKAESNHPDTTTQWLMQARHCIEQTLAAQAAALTHPPALELLGPMPALLARKAGRHRSQLLLIADQRKDLQRLLSQAVAQLEQNKKPGRLSWSMDIDPLE